MANIPVVVVPHSNAFGMVNYPSVEAVYRKPVPMEAIRELVVDLVNRKIFRLCLFIFHEIWNRTESPRFARHSVAG
ncbi:hypothetical protein [Azonexus fungiphilus]|uniref:hypothetical protein n=1 Tax=Azonexus fungiphilus TaxID=146940 RepID=UPI001472981D|nr:hypothetical protein [Azonexus fungiphilus]